MAQPDPTSDQDLHREPDLRRASPLAREMHARLRELLKKYHTLTERHSRLVPLGHWLAFHAQEGVALVRAGDPALVTNQRFYQLCRSASAAVCVSGAADGPPRPLRERVLELGRRLLGESSEGRAGAPEARPRILYHDAAHGTYIEAELRPLVRRGPGPLAAVVVLRDVTESQTLLREREEGRRRDEFLAMLAHELRGPLAPVLASAEQILHDSGEGPVRHAAERILRQARHQARLIEDLLDAARVRQGKIVLKLETVDLREVLREAVAGTAPLRAGKVGLHVGLPGEPVWVRGDATRLVQCVSNLLSNAAKYTPPGGHNWLELQAGADLAWVRVRDDGVGIEPGLLPHVFEVFTQAEQSLDRSQGGLGLGLALVRSLMELHQGGARASSEGPGRGAEFTLWLQRSAAPAEQPAAGATGAVAVEGEPRGRAVLVVEDNEDLRDTLCEMLQVEGWKTHAAANGLRGVEVALREHPDVILTDLGLPLLSGYELAERLRLALPETRLIAMSGYSRGEDRERARRAGFNGYLVKPVDFRLLLQELAGGPAARSA